jgi:hypothetical protein
MGRLILALALLLAAPAHAPAYADERAGQTLEAMSAHAQSFQLWIHARYPRPPITQEQIVDLPRPDVTVRCGRAGCREQLGAFLPLFRAARELPTCRGFPSYAALRLLDGRGAEIALVYITSAQPTVFELQGVCYDAGREIEFTGDVFNGLMRRVR